MWKMKFPESGRGNCNLLAKNKRRKEPSALAWPRHGNRPRIDSLHLMSKPPLVSITWSSWSTWLCFSTEKTWRPPTQTGTGPFCRVYDAAIRRFNKVGCCKIQLHLHCPWALYTGAPFLLPEIMRQKEHKTEYHSTVRNLIVFQFLWQWRHSTCTTLKHETRETLETKP